MHFIGAAVTATSLSCERLPASFLCIKLQWIFAIGLAATSPGFGAGDGIPSPRADTNAGAPSWPRWKREEAAGTCFVTENNHRLS
jgi:hypothetical protein